MKIFPSSMRARQENALRGCATMFRRSGEVSTAATLFCTGATTSARKVGPYAGNSRVQ